MTSISAIRQRILEQAMRGKLVPQDKNDEPASVLLKKIQEEKEKMRKEGKLKKQKPLPPIEEKEIPYELPEGWMWVRLGEIVELLNGRAYKKHELLEKGKTPVLRVGNFFTNQSWYYSDLDLDEDKYCDDGDLLYAWSASFGPKIWRGPRVIYHYHIWKIRIFGGINKKYLYYMLLKDVNDIKDATTGSTMVHISKENMEKRVFPLPPLVEQQRIVEKIEKLFTLCDQWEKEVKFQQHHIQTLREKVLADAIRGLLVEQNEDDEPASVLLKRMKEEKKRWVKEGKIEKQKTLAPINSDEIPFEIPTTWEWVRLGEIAMINPRNKLDDDIDVGFMPMSLLEEGYSGKHSYEIRKWGEVKKGYTHFQERDIVVAKITPCFENKKSAIMRNLPNGYGAGTTELHVIRPFSGYVLAEYLMLIFKSDWFVEAGVSNFTGTAGQQRIPKDFIENYPIPLPPYEEQKRIVKKVEIIMETIEVMEKNIVPIK